MHWSDLKTLYISVTIALAIGIGCGDATTNAADEPVEIEEDTTDELENDTISDSPSDTDTDTESSTSQSADCTTCHGNPPLTGAHEIHVANLELSCSACHGHNGSGASHNSGELDLTFDASISYPAGTTMDNDHAAIADQDADPVTCQVGCHNPVVGDSVDLTNTVEWTAGTLSCVDCHENVGTELPDNHPMGTTVVEINTRCVICHDQSDHMSGNMAIADPDPNDDFQYNNDPTALNGLCFTCHDGSDITFGGASPINLVGKHPDKHPALDCSDCHGYHTNGPNNLALQPGGCHDNGCHSH